MFLDIFVCIFASQFKHNIKMSIKNNLTSIFSTVVLTSILITTSVLTSCSKHDDVFASESQNSANIARAFYNEVIVNKDMTKFDKFIGSSYLQHATGYADGIAPLRGELQSNSTSSNKIQILRVVGEKNYAAIHSLWTIGTQLRLYVDVWRVENGKLVEHWAQYQNVENNSLNNNTMHSGPDTNIKASQDTEMNRTRAISVLKVFDNLEDLNPIENYVSGNYIQHNPTVADGKKAFVKMLKNLKSINYKSKTTIGKAIANGDMVIIHSKVIDTSIPDDKGTGAMDIFRFDNKGQIVEHWDVLERITGISLNKNDPFYYPN